ncbi:probable protein phosphatase 2C 43 [Solanum pennellii]|uniref:protein-serine/threonine phosphatase n=1 Tax=Solanum pennellii TaxID=28526 RepID=A0ABM1FDH7_SOLPN|nr:probable protein phosphatase 2C 43 [Solanum pennellii]
MVSWLDRTVSACCQPLGRYIGLSSSEDGVLGGEDYPLLWYRDLEKHSCGEFSFAVVQANQVCEDYGHVEPGREGTFVGVYDGHGGLDASRFACDNLSRHLITLAREKGTIDKEVLNNAFAATEDGFLSIVEREFHDDPDIASMGSCCLVGVIWKRRLYVANLGDCRAVLGQTGIFNRIFAKQLTNDHNVRIKEVRDELRALHPDDPNIVTYVRRTWRVKSIIQVTRAIGDAFLKKVEFAIGAIPLKRPVLRADPSVCSRNLQPCDKFVIFASDGLWDLLSNQEAVKIVHAYPRQGIARRLVLSALNVAARARKLKCDDLMNYDKGVRRAFHDDITVVVIFIDHEKLNDELTVPGMSVQGYVDTHRPSDFNIEQEVATETEHTEIESTDTEPTGTESSETEPTETKHSETEPTGTERSEIELTETEATETEHSETEATGTEPTETEPTGTEPTETEATGTERSETEPTETEHSKTEPTGTEPAETERSETEHTEIEATETERSETEPTGTEAAETAPTKTELTVTV